MKPVGRNCCIKCLEFQSLLSWRSVLKNPARLKSNSLFLRVSILIVLEISFEEATPVLPLPIVLSFQSLLSWRSVLKLTRHLSLVTRYPVSILIVLEISFEATAAAAAVVLAWFQSLLSWRSVLKLQIFNNCNISWCFNPYCLGDQF